jgi:DNA mismatch repair protein MutL
VSAPRERRTTRDAQYFFVNKRFVRDKTIAAGLSDGFRSILPYGVFPVALLFLDIPLEEIDVNVHPAKTEIRFRRGEAVKDVIAEAVRTSLANAGVSGDVYQQPEITGRTLSSSEQGPPFSFSPEMEQSVIQFEVEAGGAGIDDNKHSYPADAVAQTIPAARDVTALEAQQESTVETISVSSADFEKWAETRAESAYAGMTTGGTGGPAAQHHTALPPVNSASKLARSIEVGQLSSAMIQPLGQLHESFIIAVDDEGLLLIDQHVAHERILFDKYRKSETERPIESQNLLLPETIDLSPAQAEAFRLIEGDLEFLGFGLMRLSGRTVAIKSVPTDLPTSEARNLFAEILDTVEAENRGGAKTTLRDDIAASLACKAAVKINMKLTTEKMRWLIDKLLQTTSPTTCPHGRPVILRLSMRDIERGFHRT